MSNETNPEAAYLDNNATTPVSASVLDAMLPWFRDEPGNPSSLHGPGERALAAVSKARRQVATLLGAASPREVHFTSGGTESVNSALSSALATGLRNGRTLAITSAVEHPATSEFLEARAKCDDQIEIQTIGVDDQGNLDVPALLALLEARGQECALVSLLMVNNETGHILRPDHIRAIGAAARAAGALVHLDAVQAAGKLPLSIGDLPIDMASISSHKFHGPKGVGALYVRRDTPFESLLFGGPQEGARRAGTENVPGIVGFGAAAVLAKAYADSEPNREAVGARRDKLERALVEAIPSARVASADAARVETAACVEFPGIDGEAALLMLAQLGISVSTGSACGSSHHAPSHVLLAMGRSEEEAASSLRFSLSRETTDAEVNLAVSIVPTVITALRSLAPDLS